MPKLLEDFDRRGAVSFDSPEHGQGRGVDPPGTYRA